LNKVNLKSILSWAKKNGYKFSKGRLYNEELLISGPKKITDADYESISFSSTPVNLKSGVIFSSSNSESSILTILTDKPKLSFVKCISELFTPDPCKVIVGENVVIEDMCSIGNDGFGYVKDEDSGEWVKFPHFGNIVIGDNVTIKDFATVARGTLGDTIIGSGTKIDCRVHIAHNVEIGKNCMVIANAMIAGSVSIGDGCWIGPSSSIINKAKIGDNVFVGIGANVISDIPNNAVVVGNPGKIIRFQK
tara:strand:+ start:176 stop:922 length:747 start_codon:yes stop_codon:yes gene_type:complete